MLGKLGDQVRLQHIIDAIDEIEDYVSDSGLIQFSKNSMMRFACIKQMEIIGEAANHISSETKMQFSKIQWSQIIGLRNILIPEYFGVDSGLVWDIIKNDIPELRRNVAQILIAIRPA